MTLQYELDGQEFEYEIDYSQLKYFLEKQLSKKELLDFIVETWQNLDDKSKEKQEIASMWNVKEEKDWETLMEDDFSLLIDFISDHEEEFMESFEDEITDFFYEEAIEAEEESRDQERDPHSYFGVSDKDFF
jgi:hypothetical protein